MGMPPKREKANHNEILQQECQVPALSAVITKQNKRLQRVLFSCDNFIKELVTFFRMRSLFSSFLSL